MAALPRPLNRPLSYESTLPFISQGEPQYMTAEDVLTTAQAAAHLTVSEKTLRRWREEGKGPDYRRDPDGRIIYTRGALTAWRETQFVVSIIYAPIKVPSTTAAA